MVKFNLEIIFLSFLLLISIVTTFIILLMRGDDGPRGEPGTRGQNIPNPKNEVIQSIMKTSTLNLQVKESVIPSLGNYVYFTDELENYEFTIHSEIYQKQNITMYISNQQNKENRKEENVIMNFQNFDDVFGNSYYKSKNINISNNFVFGIVSLENNQIFVFQNSTSF
jgi:hypothetical protein